MRRIFLAAALAITAISIHAEALTGNGIQSMSSDNIERNLPDSHPSAYFAYARKLFDGGQQDAAVRWYYVGLIRYRAHLLSNPELIANPDLLATGDPAELAAITTGFGPTVTDWAGGDIHAWLRAIDEALAWDASHPNNFTPKKSHGPDIQQARDEVTRTRDTIRSNEAQIRSARAAKGLPDR